MSFERQHAHANRAQDRAHDEDLVPGRASASSRLTSPAEPVVSALVMRKARDANGVAEGAESAVVAAASTAGEPLPATIQRKFEASLGADLSGVRVHTGAESQSAANAVGAKAYTVGNDIHFGAGQYDPSSTSGQHLLAHEVAHTVQQRGTGPMRQNKLEVSAPHDAAEVEADRAADAMVAGHKATPSSGTGLARQVIAREKKPSLADQMEDEASYEEARAEASPPILLGEASSIDSTHQARAHMAKIDAANANLFHRKAHHERLKEEAWTYKSKAAQDKIVEETQRHIEANGKVRESLQKLVDLGTGHALVGDEGHRAGFETRAAAFAALYAIAMADFARVQGVVKAFLGKNPKIDAPGEGDMGRAIATGKADGDTAKTHAKVQAQLKRDEPLKKLVDELKARIDAYEGADYSEKIDKQIGECTGATTALKNVQIKQELSPKYDDSPEQQAAKKKVAKVQADLAEAKAGIDRVGKVVMLAAAALGAPAIGALGESSVLTQTINSAKASPYVSIPTQAVTQGSAASSALGVDIGDKIKTEVTKMMTEYDKRIDKANGELQAANHCQAYKVLMLNRADVKHAIAEVNKHVDSLVKLLKQMKKQKDDIKDTMSKIRAHQAKHGTKGGPDIAAMSRAVGECTVFIQSGRSAIKQGEEEQKIAEEIAQGRVELAGKWNTGKKSFTGIADNGAPMEVRELYGSSKEAYYDCESSEPFKITKKPIEFSIWSDKPMNSPEVARGAVEPKLKELKERVQTVEADKLALQNAMFGPPT